MRTTEHAETAVAGTEGGFRRETEGLPQPPFRVAEGASVPSVVVMFWSAETDGGGRLLTWQDFFLCRDTNTSVSAQLELMPSGDFIVRSNEVERVYRRVDPDDWDDDGIPNDYDLDPYVYDGDNFGPHQTLPEGANSNAYCWVDVVVGPVDSLVTFVGDGPSALPDPMFMARAGETNRVILLIGKAYQVRSRMPITCVGQSSGEIEIDQVSATELSICWSVEIECGGMRSASSTFAMSVWPDWLGGGFTWTNSCCQISSLGEWRYSYMCAERNCRCLGCAAVGYYGYEAYRLPASGGSCGCWSDGEDDGGDDEMSAGVSVSFSHDVLFYESEFVNDIGVTVPASGDEEVTLSCSACGGERGGVLSLTLSNIDKLRWLSGDVLPSSSVELAANETRSWSATYGFASHSDAIDDVRASGTLTENLSGDVHGSEDRMTVVELTVAAVATWPTNQYRRSFGVGEVVMIYKTPNIATTVEALRGTCNDDIVYSCPHTGDYDSVTISSGGSSYTMSFSIWEPSGYSVMAVDSNITAAVGVSGDFEMLFRCRLLPHTVSFENVELIELPRVATDATGYYAQPSKADLLDHGQHGAGTWNEV